MRLLRFLPTVVAAILASASSDAALFPCNEPGINAAIAAGGGPHTFDCLGPTTVVTTAEIVIASDVILDGGGNLTVDGGGAHGVFRVSSGTTAEMRSIAVTGGSKRFEGGGGILNQGTLTLTDSSVIGNAAIRRFAVDTGAGGGIRNDRDGVLTLVNSTVSGNLAEVAGGGIYNDLDATLEVIDGTISDNVAANRGGGIENLGEVSLTNSSVSENTASTTTGGGIHDESSEARLTMLDSSVSGNIAREGGGIGHEYGGLLALDRSTISGNVAELEGGGILLVGVSFGTGTVANLVDTTVSGNTVGSEGGGIASIVVPDLTIKSSSIVGNTAPSGSGIAISGTPTEPSTLTLSNTLIDGDCAEITFLPFPADVISTGGNLESPGNACRLSASSDQVNVSVATLALGPLADNGGPTETHALLDGSVAIDAGVDCPPPIEDQRGVPRPQGAACDTGAYEAVLVVVVDIDVKPGNGVNPINLVSRGVIPVAILGSDSFDVLDIDVATLAFGTNGAAPAHRVGGHFEDVNDDGFIDLLSHYPTQETGIAYGDTEACVTGELLDGTPFEGCDDILTLEGCGQGFTTALLLPPAIAVHRRRSRARRASPAPPGVH